MGGGLSGGSRGSRCPLQPSSCRCRLTLPSWRPGARVLELPALGGVQAEAQIGGRLRQRGRSLQPAQWRAVREAMAAGCSPLAAELAADSICGWPSTMTPAALPTNTEQAGAHAVSSICNHQSAINMRSICDSSAYEH